MIYYGKKIKKVEGLTQKYNVKVFSFKRRLAAVNQRYPDFLKLLKEIPDNVTQLIFIDSGDVWFQGPIDQIFELTKNQCGFVEENIKADGEFNNSIINQINDGNTKAEFFKKASGFKLINGGMIAGNRKDLAYLLAELLQ